MSTLEFVCFATVILLLYYLLPRRTQPYVILAANLFYCLSAGVFCLISLLGVTVNAFFSAILVERKRSRRALVVGVSLTLSSLIITKLGSIFDGASVLFRDGNETLGLAFYSLSAVSYLIDLYRGKIKREKSFLKLFLFVGFFPCLRLGPILRFGDLSPQLNSPHAPTWEGIVSGILRVSLGYFKKLVVADTALVALRTMVASPQKYGGGYALFLIILYSVVIYADFTGGIDIAIGVGRALGIRLAENFAHPFSSQTVREYWKRWHITLGAFFSDYIFYPLSISKPMLMLSKRLRGGRFKRIGRRVPIYLALLFTWLLTGAWHGLSANFILWGLANAAVIIISQELSPAFSRFHKKYPAIRSSKAWHDLAAARTFLIIGTVRLFDLWSNALIAPRVILSIFFDADGWVSIFSGGILGLGLSLSEWIALAFGVALIFTVSRVGAIRGGRARERFLKNPLAVTSYFAFLTLATLIFGSYGAGFEESSFIYSQF